MLLADIQSNFLSAYTGESVKNNFLKYIKTTDTLSPERSFAIYADSITECLANAMREKFPVCQALVGEDCFNHLIYKYIEVTPALTPSLFGYGDEFAEFITEFSMANQVAYLPDVCRLEWAWLQSYYGADMHVFDVSALMNVSEEEQNNIIFSLPRNSTLLQSDYPIDEIWYVNQADYSDEPYVDLDMGGVDLLVWRPHNDVVIQTLSQDEWYLLDLMQQGFSLGEICEAFTELDEAIDVVDLLAGAVNHGWIAGANN